MKGLENFFIQHQMAGSTDPAERNKIIVSFRFALTYLLITASTFPFCILFHRPDILSLMGFLFLQNLGALVCIKRCDNLNATVVLLAASSLINVLGNSYFASFNLSIIIFIWPVIISVFVNFVLGRKATLIFLGLFSLSVIAISIIRISVPYPFNPIDDMRINYSAGFMIVMASAFLYYFLSLHDHSRNEALSSQISAIESRNNTLHIVAHDLRNVTTSNQGCITLLQIAIKEGNAKDIQTFITLLANGTSASNSIVNDLLNSASMKSEMDNLEIEATDLSMLIQTLVNQYHPVAANKNIAIQFHPGNTSIYAEVDASKVERAFGNLITNAIKFSHPGGTLKIELEATKEVVTAKFKDNGIGIPEHLKSSIFTKHTKAGRRGTQGEYSTGLGMYIVKNFLDLHQATITVNSPECHGTEFVITIPRTFQKATAKRTLMDRLIPTGQIQ
jgi:signal transduction histidine kinase